MDTAALYRETRERITAFVGGLSSEQLETMVPAAPLWRVRDVVAHLSGGVADILAGNLEGVATDPWTAAQVDARRSWPVEQILEEWSANGPQVEAIVNDFGGAGRQLLADCVTHEHDIRGAVNEPGERGSAALDGSLQWRIVGLGKSLPSGLRLVAGDQEWVIGPDDSQVASAIAPSSFEVFRALIGRRSEAQVRAWKWDGDPADFLARCAPWGFPTADVVE
jgi:uncharacterized protein (TIGR03083 family)